jgi:hypothetical protein
VEFHAASVGEMNRGVNEDPTHECRW